MTAAAKTRADGAGRLRERRPGVWEGSTRVGSGRTGRHVSKTFHATGKRDAERQMREWLATLPQAPAAGTFGDLLAKWLDECRETVEPKTFRGYDDAVRFILPHLGDVKLADLDTPTFQAFYFGPGCTTAAMAHSRHRVIRAALNFGLRTGMVPVNYVADKRVKLPAHHAREITPPSADVAEMLTRAAFATDETLASLIFVALATGARRGELCGLRWHNVDLDAGTLRYAVSLSQVGREVFEGDTKTHQSRTVELDTVCVAMLRRVRAASEDRARRCATILGPNAFVFSKASDSSAYLVPDSVTAWWRRLANKVEGAEDVRLHDLRHYMATRWIAAGEPLPVVSKRLGHKMVSTTANIYAHVEAGAQAAAAERLASGLPSVPLAIGSAS